MASVDEYITAIQKLLGTARKTKAGAGIEPSLTSQDFGGEIEEIGKLSHDDKQRSYAAIETAFRKTFYDLIVSSLAPWRDYAKPQRLRFPSTILPSAESGIYWMPCPVCQT